MSEAYYINMGGKGRKENMTPQKVNNHTIEGLVDSEGCKFPVTGYRNDKNV
jgi:hypothetical protein